MIQLRTAKKIFEEELSGEPLHQDAVIEAIQIAQWEIINNVKSEYMISGMCLDNLSDIVNKLELNKK
jgi:hypothetical protein